MGGYEERILVTGAAGQIGSELTLELRRRYGAENVIAGVHKKMPKEIIESGPYERIDTTDISGIRACVEKHNITTIYHLVSILSAAGEKNSNLAWHVNMTSLKNVLDVMRERKEKGYTAKVFWPSSIAAFGPDAPKDNTPQDTVMHPTTIYGVTKVSGELLCNYYWLKYGVDVRSVRYPGLISSMTPPGGGTSDYAVEVFYEAIKNGHYTFFVRADTVLPMMYMPDAIRATIMLMEADEDALSTRLSYNLAAMSFSAGELAEEVKKHIPGFSYDFRPDERQVIADSWPRIIDDSCARRDWGWKEKFNLKEMVSDMIEKLEPSLKFS